MAKNDRGRRRTTHIEHTQKQQKKTKYYERQHNEGVTPSCLWNGNTIGVHTINERGVHAVCVHTFVDHNSVERMHVLSAVDDAASIEVVDDNALKEQTAAYARYVCTGDRLHAAIDGLEKNSNHLQRQLASNVREQKQSRGGVVRTRTSAQKLEKLKRCPNGCAI